MILDLLKNYDLSLVGFADLSDVESDYTKEMKYGICIAVALDVFPSMSDLPDPNYYYEYRDVNSRLKGCSLYLEDAIKSIGFNAVSLTRERQNEEYRMPLPFKTLAVKAGIGWIGKSSLLITKEYGNAVRLNGVVTDMPFITSKALAKSLCGECNECVKACPVGAILGNSWDISRDRNELVNPYKCKAKVIERGKQLGLTVGTCGICIGACPYTKRYIKRKLG